MSSRWSVEWDDYLASARDFVVAHMDVRGSGFSGHDFKHAVHRQLGTVEVVDSLHVIRYFSTAIRARLHYVTKPCDIRRMTV